MIIIFAQINFYYFTQYKFNINYINLKIVFLNYFQTYFLIIICLVL